MDEQYRRRREEEAAWRRERLPVWAEWAAWRWSRGEVAQKQVGVELGGVLATSISQAIKDYLFVATDAPFWLYRGIYGYDYGGWWAIGIHARARQELLRKHFGDRVPPFPGLVPQPRRVDMTERNSWIVRQRRAGRTLKSIGVEVGICPQRVRQICRAVERKSKAG
jgi:hypothetical protein